MAAPATDSLTTSAETQSSAAILTYEASVHPTSVEPRWKSSVQEMPLEEKKLPAAEFKVGRKVRATTTTKGKRQVCICIVDDAKYDSQNRVWTYRLKDETTSAYFGSSSTYVRENELKHG